MGPRMWTGIAPFVDAGRIFPSCSPLLRGFPSPASDYHLPLALPRALQRMNATSTQQYLDMVKEASDFIIGRLGTAKIALVLGSGLGPFVGYLTDVKEVPFKFRSFSLSHAPASLWLTPCLFPTCRVSRRWGQEQGAGTGGRAFFLNFSSPGRAAHANHVRRGPRW